MYGIPWATRTSREKEIELEIEKYEKKVKESLFLILRIIKRE